MASTRAITKYFSEVYGNGNVHYIETALADNYQGFQSDAPTNKHQVLESTAAKLGLSKTGHINYHLSDIAIHGNKATFKVTFSGEPIVTGHPKFEAAYESEWTFNEFGKVVSSHPKLVSHPKDVHDLRDFIADKKGVKHFF